MLTLLILSSFVFLGCAPASSSSPEAQQIQLPAHPDSENGVAARALLFKNDARVSYCEILNNDSKTYSGFRDTSLEPLASLSKVITTTWAAEVLGAEYRFENEWHLKPVLGSDGQFDAYLKTNYDPIINIEKLLYFLSELHALGVKSIRQMVIDETTRVYISVLSQPHLELKSTPVTSDETKDNINLILNSKNWATRTVRAREKLMAWAAKNNKSVIVPSTFTVEQIVIKNSGQMNVNSYPIHKVLKSAPLYKYLKNMNVNSNNYLADALFESLGGAKAFASFQQAKLKLDRKDLIIFTGSGLADHTSGQRQDNLGSCFGMLTVLSYLRQLTAKAQVNLGHILLNPTTDKNGTFETVSEYKNSVVLKTGRLFDNPALNLTGFVATDQGLVSFVFLGHDFTLSEARAIDKMRSDMLDHIYDNYPTTPGFQSLIEYEIFL